MVLDALTAVFKKKYFTTENSIESDLRSSQQKRHESSISATVHKNLKYITLSEILNCIGSPD